MASLGKIILDKNSSIVLEEDDEEIVQFLKCEEVEIIRQDRVRFNYFFNDMLLSGGWTMAY